MVLGCGLLSRLKDPPELGARDQSGWVNGGNGFPAGQRLTWTVFDDVGIMLLAIMLIGIIAGAGLGW